MTSPKNQKSRGPGALRRTLDEAEALDDLDEIANMTDAELDAHITSQGGDPARIREAGKNLVAELEGKSVRQPWRTGVDAKIRALRTDVATRMNRRERPPRAELLSRIERAKSDPRFTAPVTALFQRKTAEESTDDELEAMLVQIELLAKIEET